MHFEPGITRFVSVARGVFWFLGQSPFANRSALPERRKRDVTLDPLAYVAGKAEAAE